MHVRKERYFLLLSPHYATFLIRSFYIIDILDFVSQFTHDLSLASSVLTNKLTVEGTLVSLRKK